MKELYLEIVQRLQPLITSGKLKYIGLWNNQFERMNSGETFSFPFNCLFIEFFDPQPKQLGNGVQIYEPLSVRLHIGMEKYNEDGHQDRNIEQFDLTQSVYAQIQGFKVDRSGTFTRQSEMFDYNHTNVTVNMQEYLTSWVDYQELAPVESVEKQPPTALVLNADLNDEIE